MSCSGGASYGGMRRSAVPAAEIAETVPAAEIAETVVSPPLRGVQAAPQCLSGSAQLCR